MSGLASSAISSSNDSKPIVDKCIDFVWTNATLKIVSSFLELNYPGNAGRKMVI